jgi:hypothetical protein
VAHSCNPSYSGGRDQEDFGSKPAQANSSAGPYLEKPFTKIGLVGWLKVKALSSSSSTAKQKKQKTKKKEEEEKHRILERFKRRNIFLFQQASSFKVMIASSAPLFPYSIEP